MIPPPDDDTSTIPTVLLAAYERLYAEVGREPIGRVRRETTAAFYEAQRARDPRRRRRRGDAG